MFIRTNGSGCSGVISQTDFVPNEAARTLFKKSARTIGLIIPSIRNPYFTQMASAVDGECRANGYRLFLCNVTEIPSRSGRRCRCWHP